MRRELVPLFSSFLEKAQIVDESLDAAFIHEIVQSVPLHFMSDGSIGPQQSPILDADVLLTAARNIRRAEKTSLWIFEMFCSGIPNFKNTKQEALFKRSFESLIDTLDERVSTEYAEKLIKSLSYCGHSSELVWFQEVLAKFVNTFPKTASQFIPEWLIYPEIPDKETLEKSDYDVFLEVMFPDSAEESSKISDNKIHLEVKCAYARCSANQKILESFMEDISFALLEPDSSYQEKKYVVALFANPHLTSVQWEKLLTFFKNLQGYNRQMAIREFWANSSLSLETKKQYLKILNFY